MWACKDFCALGSIPVINRSKGDSPIFADHRRPSVDGARENWDSSRLLRAAFTCRIRDGVFFGSNGRNDTTVMRYTIETALDFLGSISLVAPLL
jgi:hypothetical protein